MAVMKKSVRKKLSKHLARLVKKHGAEMTLALVTGIVSSLAAGQQAKADRKAAKAAKPEKHAKPEKTARPEKVARPVPAVVSRKAAKAAAPPVAVVRKRTDR
jgi:hypothetical protein